MFTGIIQAVGGVSAIESGGGDMRICVDAGTLSLHDLRVGDSIAVNGACLTVTAVAKAAFWADVSSETLSRTTCGELDIGHPVNLERALTLATPLGGHLVSGHVDGTGTILSRLDEGRSVRFSIEAPRQLGRYIPEKGSICVDGVSLTVARVEGEAFEVSIVPHTLQATTMGGFAAGRRVNLEVDIIARYLERLIRDERANEE